MLRPLGDRIVIELIEVEEKSAFGIVLPDSAKEKPQEGKVVAVGTGRVLESLTLKLTTTLFSLSTLVQKLNMKVMNT